ncbi:hypothetical protein BS17DRAFT_469851 [Gyrodon lividus]|nr:hypothetical protein BS17DRAFT_469851 [Gyrodon lividus]
MLSLKPLRGKWPRGKLGYMGAWDGSHAVGPFINWRTRKRAKEKEKKVCSTKVTQASFIQILTWMSASALGVTCELAPTQSTTSTDKWTPSVSDYLWSCGREHRRSRTH